MEEESPPPPPKPELQLVGDLPTPSAQQIEDAMIEAVLQCGREGIIDPDIILARKLAARNAITGA